MFLRHNGLFKTPTNSLSIDSQLENKLLEYQLNSESLKELNKNIFRNEENTDFEHIFHNICSKDNFVKDNIINEFLNNNLELNNYYYLKFNLNKIDNWVESCYFY
jgi:hypothetical protein